MCSDHAALRQVGDVCMQPVYDADSDVMIVYQDKIGACLRRINVGYSSMNILYYLALIAQYHLQTQMILLHSNLLQFPGT